MGNLVLTKLLSARFIVTIILSITACAMAWKGTFPTEAFTALVTLCLRDYFMRSDRAKTDEAPK